MQVPEQDRRPWALAALVLLSMAVHVPLLAGLGWYLGSLEAGAWEAPVAVQLVEGEPLDALTPEEAARLREYEILTANAAPVPEEVEEEPEEPEKELPDGQVVEVPRPNEEKVPLEADYLAEHDNAVKEETRTERYKVNPDVVANQYSDEAKLEFEDAADVGATEMSTGATVGSLSQPDEGVGAPRSAIPSPWAFTNKEGLAAPVPASSKTQSLAGAPQNDLLNEKRGQAVALNTREFVGANYINRIKRQVNLYWKQNVENLSPSVRLSKSRYATIVDVVLTQDGQLESIVISDESGSVPLDQCVVEAFKVAGPFPNPPEQLIKADGRVYLPDLDFEVHLGQAQMPYQGIDPRAGVQFPGILKSPR